MSEQKPNVTRSKVQSYLGALPLLIDKLIHTLTPFHLRMISIGFALAVWTLLLMWVLP